MKIGFDKKKTCPWYKNWKATRQRCNDKNSANFKYYGGKGIRCEITQEETKKLWFEACAWRFKQAQLSRKNHDGNYTYLNCHFTDKKENVGERNTRCLNKPILQYDLNGNFIREWESITLAAKAVNRTTSTLGDNLRGRVPTAGGFIWKYVK